MNSSFSLVLPNSFTLYLYFLVCCSHMCSVDFLFFQFYSDFSHDLFISFQFSSQTYRYKKTQFSKWHLSFLFSLLIDKMPKTKHKHKVLKLNIRCLTPSAFQMSETQTKKFQPDDDCTTKAILFVLISVTSCLMPWVPDRIINYCN